MGKVVTSFLLGLSTVAAAQPAKPAPVPPPQRATGLICNEGATGNRGVWLEIDSHSLFMTSITLGAVGSLDADFHKKFFPDHPRGSKPTTTTLSLSVHQGTCMPDESAGAKALISCTATDATAPTATLQYYVAPDELTVQRSISVTNVKLDVLKNDAGGLALAVSFDAVVRKKKVKYAFTKTFGALQQRRGPNDVGAPAQGCAVAAGVSVNKLQ